MVRTLIVILLVLILGLTLANVRPPAATTTPSPAPALERVREVAEVSILEVDVSAITIARIDGYTGGVRCCLIATGAARIGADLERATLHSIDHAAGTLVVALPEPTVLSVRIDPTASRVYSVDRNGLWIALPFATREGQVTARAWAAAESKLHEAADRSGLIARARRRAATLVKTAIEPLGWSVTIDWQPTGPAE